MFNNPISDTPFVGEYQDSFFRISANQPAFPRLGGDVSFLSTLRALLQPRLTKENTTLLFGQETVVPNTEPDIDKIKAYLHLNTFSGENVLVLTGVTGSHADDFVDKITPECFDEGEFSEISKVHLYFRKAINVRCFVDKERKISHLICSGLDVRRYHFLQCGIMAYLPWFFNPDDGISEDEMSLVKSLKNDTKDKYIEILNKMAKQYDFREMKIKNLLGDFENVLERTKLASERNTLDRINRDIQSLMNQIQDYSIQRRDLMTNIMGAELRISQSTTGEIMDFFLRNPYLNVVAVDESRLEFVVEAECVNFDSEMAETMISNERSYIYRDSYDRPYNSSIKSKDMARLMRAIFVDQKLQINFCAAYVFQLGQRVRAISGYAYDSFYANATPNPHIDRYACMGDYEYTITQSILDGNYIMALAQTVASCQSLNFGDGAVLSEFMARMYGQRTGINMHCIKLPSGEYATPVEAIAWLDANEQQEEE